jgi:hypothetical protein
MRFKLDQIARWYEQHAQTFDLFPDYIKAIYSRWHDYLWGAPLLAPIIVWYLLGHPPMWVIGWTFVSALLVAGYYAWREEHLKATTRRFKSWIPDMAIDNGRLFISLRIVNLGPPTSINTWQAGYKKGGQGRNHLNERFFLESDEISEVPENIHGQNLKRDYRRFETGETREGWIAFDVGPLSKDDAISITSTVSLQFTDAFDHRHEISFLQEFARKIADGAF